MPFFKKKSFSQLSPKSSPIPSQVSIFQSTQPLSKMKLALKQGDFKRRRGDGLAKNSKQTSKSVATKASRILKDGRYGKDSKSVAGSALAQTKPGKKK